MLFSKLSNLFKKNIYLFLIIILVFIIGLTNFKPDTFLLGWDSLSTEFNPFLGIKRSVWSGWQEYQSFGLPAGMAHSADLIRSIFIYFLTFILPLNFVRYFFHLFCLLLGGIGAYYLFSKLFKNESNFISFIGAVFYILNLGTIQIFALAFEPFSVFFAFLPWLILTFINYINSNKLFDKKYITLLVIVNFLATPMSYLQTLFFVYFLALSFISLGILFQSTKKIFTIKKLMVSSLFIFFINSFWILPQIYFLLNSNGVVENSTINQLATENVYYRNLEKGNILDFLTLQGFYFDSFETTTTTLIFDNWHKYFSNTFVNLLIFLPVFLLILGLLNYKKSSLLFYLLFLLSCIALLNNTPLFIQINQILRGVPILNQIFRSPFTKFIVLYSLVYSYFIVSGMLLIKQLTKSIKIFFLHKIINKLPAIFLLLFIVLYLPVFQGDLFPKLVKVKVPESYISLIEYFNTNVPKNSRVGLLPEYTHWGWYKNKWGYDGSGFLWYAIEQPIVSRTFDVWSYNSESYYWEIKDAIEDRDIVRFENLLDKYDIKYLIYDKSLQSLNSMDSFLQHDEIEYILGNSQNVTLQKVFDNISVYKFNKTPKIKKIINIDTLNKISNFDFPYTKFDNYYTSRESNTSKYFYLFSDLFTYTYINERNWNISESPSNFILSYKLTDDDYENYRIPSEFRHNNYYKFKYLNDEYELIEQTLPISIILIKNELNIYIPKFKIDTIANYKVLSQDCSSIDNNTTTEFNTYFYSQTLTSENGGSLCVGYENKLLQHENSYLYKVEIENIAGLLPYFYLNGSGLAKFEINLIDGINYLLIDKGYLYDDGYSFNFQNRSLKNSNTINKIYDSEIYVFPFDFVKSIYLENIANENNEYNLVYINDKVNYYTYNIDNINNENLYVLNQSYDSGWVAFCGFKPCNAEHVVVNNWSNGWIFNDISDMSKNIKIVFWPQYLQYLGYILAIIPIIFVLFYKNKK